MANISKKKWYFSRHHSYGDLTYMFSGFGTLLIEGDALIHYLFANEPIENDYVLSKHKLRNFLTKSLKESGFNQIKAIFFHQHSKWTIKNDETYTVKDSLLNIFTNLSTKYLKIFNSWNDKSWFDYLGSEHISLLLASDSNIYRSNESQFEFIYQVFRRDNLQVGLIDNMKFIDLKVFSFLIDCNREYNVSISRNNEIENEDYSQIMPVFESFDSPLFELKNDELNNILEMNENQVELKIKRLNLNASLPIKWDLKLDYQEKQEFFRKLTEDKKKQVYYRYMEMYADSLDSSKHLHHKIITDIDSKSKTAPEKLGSKAREIIQAKEKEKLKLKEEKELSFLKSLKIKCFEDIEKFFKAVDVNRYSKLALYNLLKLKIKWLQNEPFTYPNRTSNLFLFIKEIIEDFFNFLTQNEAEEYLVCLKNLGFESISNFLKSFLIKNRNDFKSLKKIEANLNTFNHDVLFQLNYCGDKLKRTLNSSEDSRVKFQPDKWQRDLLDIVDRNESALICNYI